MLPELFCLLSGMSDKKVELAAMRYPAASAVLDVNFTVLRQLSQVADSTAGKGVPGAGSNGTGEYSGIP